MTDITPEDKAEMDKAINDLGATLDPNKILEMFSGMQEGIEIGKQGLVIAQQQYNILIHINNNLIALLKKQ